jgi:hypothetical protein
MVVVELKKWQKDHVDRTAQGYYDRLQRACSWLAKAKMQSNPEARFVFSWIALNALYGIRPEVLKTDWWKNEERARPSPGEHDDDQAPRELEWFLWRICDLDVDQRSLRSVIEDNWDDAKVILGTRYLVPNFWSWKWQTDADIDKWKASSERTVKKSDRRLVGRTCTEGSARSWSGGCGFCAINSSTAVRRTFTAREGPRARANSSLVPACLVSLSGPSCG